jgi:hypothetical protein
MSLTIHVPKPDTPQRRLEAITIHGHGRPSGRVAGGWIADTIGLKQCVVLCDFCVHRFNPRRVRYELYRRTTINAFCDDCGRPSTRAAAYIHQSFHDAVGDERRSPGKGRWARHGR